MAKGQSATTIEISLKLFRRCYITMEPSELIYLLDYGSMHFDFGLVTSLFPTDAVCIVLVHSFNDQTNLSNDRISHNF